MLDDLTEDNKIFMLYEIEREIKSDYFLDMCIIPLIKFAWIYTLWIIIPLVSERILLYLFDTLVSFTRFMDIIRIGCAYCGFIKLCKSFNIIISNTNMWLWGLIGDISLRIKKEKSLKLHLERLKNFVYSYKQRLEQFEQSGGIIWMSAAYLIVGAVLYYFIRKGV